jgi:23S rRNA pseudouridine2605 synthase
MPRAPRDKIRLQKFLSDAGVASRRHAEDLILEGRVLVNDVIVDELPAFVDPNSDVVVANGVRVRPQHNEYFICHKPKGVVCTNRDPAGRIRAVDLLPPMRMRLFPVGRLDVESTGLLLMTNDGELAEQVTHPRYGIPKTYRVEVKGNVSGDLIEKMKAGVHLAEGKARASDVVIHHTSRERSVLTVTLREGRNRQVRRMLAKLNHPVKSLKRIEIGPLTLKGLPVGASRRLRDGEVRELKRTLQTLPRQRRPRRRSSDTGPATAKKPRQKPPAQKKSDAAKPATPPGPQRRIIS